MKTLRARHETARRGPSAQFDDRAVRFGIMLAWCKKLRLLHFSLNFRPSLGKESLSILSCRTVVTPVNIVINLGRLMGKARALPIVGLSLDGNGPSFRMTIPGEAILANCGAAEYLEMSHAMQEMPI